MVGRNGSCKKRRKNRKEKIKKGEEKVRKMTKNKENISFKK